MYVYAGMFMDVVVCDWICWYVYGYAGMCVYGGMCMYMLVSACM